MLQSKVGEPWELSQASNQMKLKAMQASVVRVWPSSGSDVTHFFGLDVQVHELPVVFIL